MLLATSLMRGHMKVSDFKLLAELPEEYDYEIFTQGFDGYLIIGKLHHTIIGFLLKENQLNQVQFETEERTK